MRWQSALWVKVNFCGTYGTYVTIWRQMSYFVICHNMITENGDNHWCCCKRRKWCLGWFWPCWCVLTIAHCIVTLTQLRLIRITQMTFYESTHLAIGASFKIFSLLIEWKWQWQWQWPCHWCQLVSFHCWMNVLILSENGKCILTAWKI